MSIDRYEILSRQVKQRYPRFTVKERNGTWLGRLFRVLAKVTRQDYDSFTTTIFSTMYVGADWRSDSSDEKYSTLRHEMQHIDQFHRFPLGRWAWPVNHALMALCYLLVLPVLWTLRAKFEREGYAQTLLVQYELYGEFSEGRMEDNARWMAETFGGSAYFFMWRRKAAYAWAMETQRRINAGELTNPTDRVEVPRVVPLASSSALRG